MSPKGTAGRVRAAIRTCNLNDLTLARPLLSKWWGQAAPKTEDSMRPRQILLAAFLLGTTAVPAMAQPAATYDPQQLPAIQGRVAQYSLTPRGDVDGLILTNGIQVHLPPHLGNQLVQVVRPGDEVTVHGLKARALPLVQALSVTNDASGRGVVDTGPPPAPPGALATNSGWLQVRGRVRESLYGPRGDLNGALLENGTQVHLPPDQAWSLRNDLAPGRVLVAEGYGVSGPYGTSVDAREIGQSPTSLVRVGPPRPHGPKGHGPKGFPPPPPGGPGAPPPPPPG